MHDPIYTFYVFTIIVVAEYVIPDSWEYKNDFLNLVNLREGSQWIADYLYNLAQKQKINPDLVEEKFYKECKQIINKVLTIDHDYE